MRFPPRLTMLVALVVLEGLTGCRTPHRGQPRSSQPSDTSIRQRYHCSRATSSITVDGRLDEPAWWRAPWSAAFVDIEGDARPRPPLETRIKMLWDDQHLYVGAWLAEPHVWATLTEHDAIVFRDNDFEVFIDPDGDAADYFEMEINACGTIFDLFLPKTYRAGGKADHDWNVVGLRSRVHVDGTLDDPADRDRGWSVEMAIPFAALAPQAGVACPPRPGDAWRINFSRVEWQHRIADGRYEKVPDTLENNWVWSPQGEIDMHIPQRWGIVVFEGSGR